jgi:Protein of unknown function (DUF3435)
LAEHVDLKRFFNSTIYGELPEKKSPVGVPFHVIGFNANDITEALTSEECNQIMGHQHRGTYTWYYMLGFIDQDCQAIYLGSPSRDDLVRAVGRLVQDGLAPTALTHAQKLDITNDTRVLKLCRKRQDYADRIKRLGYPSSRLPRELSCIKNTRQYRPTSIT